MLAVALNPHVSELLDVWHNAEVVPAHQPEHITFAAHLPDQVAGSCSRISACHLV